MTNPTLHPLELILQQCAQAAPQPWYPSVYARGRGLSRDSLDPYLDQLRLGGLIHLTPWAQETGQGYALTDEGRRVLADPSALAKLRTGKLTLRTEPDRPATRSGKDAPSAWERGEVIRNALFSGGDPLVVRILIAATVFWFLLGLFLGLQRDVTAVTYLGVRTLVGADQRDRVVRLQEAFAYERLQEQLGVANGPALAQGEWWRLVSYAFVHWGLFHLLMNMYGLFVLGRLAEQMWGRVRFLVLYLVTAIGGSTLALLHNPFVLLGGASGSICGLLAGSGVWILLNREHLPPQLVSLAMRNFVINIVLISFVSMMPGVSAAGHLGGAALGAVVGGLLSINRFGTRLQRWLSAGGVVLATVSCVALLLWAIVHDRKWQQTRGPAAVKTNSDDLYRSYLPRAQRVHEEADTLYRTEIYPLLVQPAAQREPRAVQDALASLSQLRARLHQAALELKQAAGPYTDRLAEAVRIQRSNHLWHKAQLQDLLISRLQAGAAWSTEDIGTLEVMRAQERELDRSWWDLSQRLPRQAPAPSAEQGHPPGDAINPQPLP